MEGKFNKQPEIETPTAEVIKTVEAAPVDSNYQKLLNFFQESDKNGLQVTNEVMEGEFNKVLGMGVSEFLTEEISNPVIKSIHDQVAVEIEKRKSQETVKPKTILESARKFFVKYKLLFLSAAMLSQVNQGFAQENKTEGGDKDKNKTELKDASVLNASNFFKDDEATISKENISKISSDHHAILNKINAANYEDYMEAKKIIYASASKSVTPYPETGKTKTPTLEGNIELAKDRGTSVETILEHDDDTHVYKTEQGLNENQINSLRNIEYEVKIPEKGYLEITELNIINPDTGKNYTDSDVGGIEKNDPSRYKSLMALCRKVEINLMVENKKTELFTTNDFDKISFTIDISPSTEKSRDELAESVKKTIKDHPSLANKPTTIMLFSDKIYEVVNLKHLSDVPQFIKTVETVEAGNEKQMTTNIEYIKEIIKSNNEKYPDAKDIPKQELILLTDEAIHDAGGIYTLAGLANDANANVSLALKGGLIVRLNDVKRMLDKAILEVSKREQLVTGQQEADISKDSKTITYDAALILAFRKNNPHIEIGSITTKDGESFKFNTDLRGAKDAVVFDLQS